MPELPELTVLKRQLTELLLPCTFNDNDVLFIKVINKELVFGLMNSQAIFIHLKLSGKISLTPSGYVRSSMTFVKKDGQKITIYLSDSRNLCKVRMAEITDSINEYNLDDIYKDLVECQRKQVHIALRSIGAGIGNYLVSEICGKANVHPQAKVKDIDIRHVANVAQELISHVISLDGSIYYEDIHGVHGGYVPKYYKNKKMHMIKYGAQHLYVRPELIH